MSKLSSNTIHYAPFRLGFQRMLLSIEVSVVVVAGHVIRRGTERERERERESGVGWR